MKLFIYLQLSLINYCQTIKLPPYFKSDCVQSMYTLLKTSTNIPFNVEDKKQIYIMYSFPLTLNQKKGVVYNLTSRNYATEIKPTQLKKGDVIQYWNGSSGHCGIFSHIANKKIYLYSSYPSSNWSLLPFDFPQELYACRIKQKHIKSKNK